MAGKVVIAGVGESAYTRWGGAERRSELGLACDAIMAALADAGIERSEVDGFASYSNDANQPALVQTALGLGEMRHSSLVWGGGGGGCAAAIGHAVASILAGETRAVVVYRALAQGQAGRLGANGARGPLSNFTAPFGLITPPQQAALVARRMMAERGVRSEDFATVALNARANAQGNQRAVMNGKPLSAADYEVSRLIADPLRLLDCCLECDAASAIVLTTRETAADLDCSAVPILAVSQGGAAGWGLSFSGGHNQPLDEYVEANARKLAPDLFARAGVTPADVDVAQFYDAFTPMVIASVASYGFAEMGDAGAYLGSGELPFNTSGGSLSEAYVHGLNLVIEAVRQMRGEALRQVPGAQVAFVAAGPGVVPTSALILGAASHG